MDEPRLEEDSMGPVQVPAGALWGAQTQRAIDNFPISSWRFGRFFIKALGLIKMAAAETNVELGLIDKAPGLAIARAAGEVAAGRHDAHFVVDVFQTGSGTSTNMNANEVIARRAQELLKQTGGAGEIDPNDHVNRCQSSNDVFPSAIHISALLAINGLLAPALDRLKASLQRKANEFSSVLKPGRTHLMDATPVTLGQEFSGWATQIENGLSRIAGCLPELGELAIGGTATGTGINAHPDFARLVAERLSAETGLPLAEAKNHFEAQGAKDAAVHASGALRTIAISMSKVAGDLRLMASGPAAGIGEITLPALQPGSSIMPGKVNPVVAESVIQVSAQVIGNDTAIAVAGMGGAFELNTMMPLIAYDLLFSIQALAAAADLLTERCVEGVRANEKRGLELLDKTVVVATALTPHIGYAKAAEVAQKAQRSGKTVKQVVIEAGLMSEQQANKVLDPSRMTAPVAE